MICPNDEDRDGICYCRDCINAACCQPMYDERGYAIFNEDGNYRPSATHRGYAIPAAPRDKGDNERWLDRQLKALAS